MAGVRSASLWAPVPHYISQPPNPPATLALLQRFGALARIHFDLTGLDGLVDMWRLQVDQAIDDNDEVKTYVRELEARVDAESAADEGVLLGDDDLPSGDQLADELQRYLRDQGDE
jgi:hypothetical protein